MEAPFVSEKHASSGAGDDDDYKSIEEEADEPIEVAEANSEDDFSEENVLIIYFANLQYFKSFSFNFIFN